MAGVVLDNNPETPRALNRLAREQMKERLLLDIRTDLVVCEIEGWDKMEYIAELQELLNGFKTGGGLNENHNNTANTGAGPARHS